MAADNQKSGKVLGIAVKEAHRMPLTDVQSAIVSEYGVEGNVRTVRNRRITLIGREGWADALHELGAALPWQTRRANVLVEGLHMPDLLGKTLQIGPLRVEVMGETEPCERMDEEHAGLRKALEPECRGGVHCQILRGGELRVGDTITVLG